MRILNPILRREINQLASDHVWTMALELTIAGAPVPFRVVNYDQDIVMNGLSFLRFPFAVDSLEEATSASLVNIRVTPQNVTQDMSSLLENYWASVADPDWSVIIWAIDATNPNLTAFGSGELFTVSSVATDLVSAVFDMIAEGLTLSATVPKRRFTTSGGFAFIPRR